MKLTPEVIRALRILQEVSAGFGSEVVIVGAVAYGLWIDDPWRATGDVDVAVAINLDRYSELSTQLIGQGWRRHAKMEHRWYTQDGVIVDIIPAGPQLRLQGKIVWPESDTVMSLVGFDHVFEKPIIIEISGGDKIKVIPLPVYMLLKTAAYLDRPEAGKDIRDIASLLERYEAVSERRFSDPVVRTGMSFQEAGAYLLGSDLGSLCNAREAEVVDAFLKQALDEESQTFRELVKQAPPIQGESKDAVVGAQLRAFLRGFQETRATARDGDDVER